MKNSIVNRHGENHSEVIMTGNAVNVRDKSAMRARLAKTKMLKPDEFDLLDWRIKDDELPVCYTFASSIFGEILVASTEKGVCFLGFTKENHEAALSDLKRRFPKNNMVEKAAAFNEAAINLMNAPTRKQPIVLHLKGTAFQVNVWKKLLEIPMGGLATYSQISGDAKGARATGAAIGQNPVGFILPCHRVIHADGGFEGYFWGTELKERLLTWETESQFSLS